MLKYNVVEDQLELDVIYIKIEYVKKHTYI